MPLVAQPRIPSSATFAATGCGRTVPNFILAQFVFRIVDIIPSPSLKDFHSFECTLFSLLPTTSSFWPVVVYDLVNFVIDDVHHGLIISAVHDIVNRDGLVLLGADLFLDAVEDRVTEIVCVRPPATAHDRPYWPMDRTVLFRIVQILKDLELTDTVSPRLFERSQRCPHIMMLTPCFELKFVVRKSQFTFELYMLPYWEQCRYVSLSYSLLNRDEHCFMS